MSRYWIIMLMLSFLFMEAGCAIHRTATATDQDPFPVRVYRTEAVSFTQEQRFTATTEANAQLDLAFRASGAVVSLYLASGRPLEPGDPVQAGAILAQLRSTEYEARVQSAEAQLSGAEAGRAVALAQVAEAQAAAHQAAADLKRAEALHSAKAMTGGELDSIRARAVAAQARLSGALTNVDTFDARIRTATALREESRIPLGDTVLTAPFPAVVVARHVECGSSVAPGAVAYTLADLRQIKVGFGIPDVALRHFPAGTTVQVSVDGLPGDRYIGRVISVAPQADPVTRLFRVQALVANPNRHIKAGMVASVVRNASEPSTMLAVPLRAIRRLGEGDRFSVLIVKGSTLQARPVTLGPARGALIGVTAGLDPGDLVVEDAGMRLNAGDHVRIVL